MSALTSGNTPILELTRTDNATHDFVLDKFDSALDL